MPSTPRYIKDGIPYITSKNIINNIINFDDVKYISEEDFYKFRKNREIYQNDFLITMIGRIGQSAIVGENTMFYGQNIYLLRFISEIINIKFFQYWFNSKSVQEKLETNKQNSNQGYLRDFQILDLQIKLPTLETQNKIVEILDTFDTMCNNLKIGLPAEETRRQQQYEYYRNLIFDKLSDKNN
ncbi:restriction endonuclease subunit S [Mycoplasma sp. 4079]|uniref:restriction endonuclease subunit S n=1 Tax=Mycoplasma sp. 4079 TaxID=3398615 RepID=UPI0039FD918B